MRDSEEQKLRKVWALMETAHLKARPFPGECEKLLIDAIEILKQVLLWDQMDAEERQ